MTTRLVNACDKDYSPPMLTQEVIEYFGSRAKTAAAIDYSRPSVYRWGKYVPEAAAYRIATVTHGRFRVDPEIYRHKATA